MKPRFLLLSAASLLLSPAIHAVEYTWSGSTGGTWNSSNTNWSGAVADPWNAANGPDNIARFNSSGHSVNVSGDVFTNGINFAQGATLTSTGTINLVGGSPSIITTNGGTIIAKLVGSNGFTKTGNNTLTLRGDNSGLSGTIFHQENRLSAGASNVVLGSEFGSGTVDVASGAFIRFFQVSNAANQNMSANLILRGTGNGQGVLQNDGNATANHMLWGGTITLAADARIDTQNSGRYTFNGDVGQSGGSRTLSLTVNGGPNTFNAGLTMGTVNHSGNGAVSFGADSVMDVGTWSSTSGTGALSFGTATVNALGTLTTNRNTSLGKENQLTATTALNVGGGTFNLGAFSQQAGVFTQTGGTVSNGTLNASSFALNGGTLAAVPGGSGTISFGGGALQQSDGTDHSARFSTLAGQQYRIDVSGAGNSVTWATDLVSTGSTLGKFGAGTLHLTGDNSGLGGTLSFGGNGINAGHILPGHANALGGISNIHLGGTQTGGVSGIMLEGGLAFSQTLTTAGRQNADTTGYVLRNLSGDNAWNGSITITDGGGSYGFISNTGTLTLGGDMQSTWVSTFAARAVSFSGEGNFMVTGDLLGGGPNSQNLALTKSGSGTLTVAGTNNTYTGNTTVSAGTLLVTGALGATNVSVAADAVIGGSGSLAGDLTLSSGANFLFDPLSTLTLTAGTVSFGGFGIANLIGLDGSVAENTYTLIQNTGIAVIDFTNVSNLGIANAVPIGGGKSAYLEPGSLQVVVIPEPSGLLLGAGGLLLAALRRRRP
jgi:autotransporter-associated beta strand protein